jgi:redox-sensitive bicupin YhaK (pirin superfamily)
MLDQIGEVEYAPGEPKGTPWHPHRGFETVTYMIDGETAHQDSTGGGGLITNGDTQWMTAGAGILHIERPPEHLVRSGGLFHGVQLWVNLPAAKKFVEPRYQDIGAARVALVASPDGGALVRIIAGSLDGHRGPGVTHTPIVLAHATLAPSARLSLTWPPAYNALVYLLNGRGTVGAERRPIHTGQLAVFGQGDTVDLSADLSRDSNDSNLDVLILGGLPIGERVVHYGPFVMNSEDEIRQTIADYKGGRLSTIPVSRHVPE